MSEEVRTSPLSGNKNWQRMWRGQAISTFGDMVFMVTVMLWIATRIADGKSWAPIAVSGALIATAVPALLVGPVAGVWVDRWDGRRTMLVADAARMLLIAALLTIPLLQHTISTAAQLAILYAVLAAASSFAEFFHPSRLAVIGAIVPSADQTTASGRLQAVTALAQVLGPPLAAPLLLTFGVQWALIANALSFGISWLYVRAIGIPAAGQPVIRARSSFGTEFRAGIRFFAGSRVLVGLAVGAVILMAGVGAINAVVVFFVVDNLHASAGWVGVISAAIGTGAVLGTITTGVVARVVGLGRLPWLGLLGGGIAIIALSRCTAVGPAIAASFVLGIAVGIINATDQPITLRVTPPDMIGRVSAVFSPLVQLANLVGMGLAGLLAGGAWKSLHRAVAGTTFGPYDTILAVAGVLFILAALVTIRPMRHLPEAAPHQAMAEDGAEPVLATGEYGAQ
ncbi:MFS transporter [Hamadaea tsunoensis]|uniref:MFS transporter n=1 Tax=Hamadaea tsunoensis TaxID=53368 RepID=UPI0006856B55|nr:MFS transporter [Hamadaea tsunoensis]